MADDAKAAGLRKAAEVVQRSVTRVSSSKKIHATWTVAKRGDTFLVTTDHLPAWMINNNRRHPVFAKGEDRRKWTWVHEDSKKRKGDEGLYDRAVDRTVDLAGDALLSEYVDRVAVEYGFGR